MRKLFANFLILLATAAPAHAETQQAYEMKHSIDAIELRGCVLSYAMEFSRRFASSEFNKHFAPWAMTTCSVEISHVVTKFGVNATNDLLADLQSMAHDIIVND